MDKKKSRSISQNNAEERRVLELQDAFAPAFSSFSSMMNFAASYLHVHVFKSGGKLYEIAKAMQEVALVNSYQDAGAIPTKDEVPNLGPQRAETIDSGARPGKSLNHHKRNRLERPVSGVDYCPEATAYRITPFRLLFAKRVA